MTKLSTRKTKLKFETGAEVRYRGQSRAVVVEVDNHHYIYVRLAGTRTRYAIGFGTIFAKAAQIAADNLRQQRKEARLARRKART